VFDRSRMIDRMANSPKPSAMSTRTAASSEIATNTPVHLPFHGFDLGIGALHWAVAARHAQPGDHSGLVFAQPADEGVPRGQIAGLD
jgi:hypothetical protein